MSASAGALVLITVPRLQAPRRVGCNGADRCTHTRYLTCTLPFVPCPTRPPQGFHKIGYTPAGRGFNSSFGFLQGGEDHWTSRGGVNCRKEAAGANTVDLCFGTNNGSTITYSPAIGLNGTGPNDDEHYTGQLFSERAVKVIEEHPKDKDLFLYLALHNTHAPVEAPRRFVALYNSTGFCSKEQTFNAQVSFVDETARNVSEALKRVGLWDNTLFLW